MVLVSLLSSTVDHGVKPSHISFIALQVYGVPNIDIEVSLVRTNLAPRTIMRGPGMINAAMVMEEILERVSHHVGRDAVAVRQLNFPTGPTLAHQSSQSMHFLPFSC